VSEPPEHSDDVRKQSNVGGDDDCVERVDK
jgi:hypothetical protein